MLPIPTYTKEELNFEHILLLRARVSAVFYFYSKGTLKKKDPKRFEPMPSTRSSSEKNCVKGVEFPSLMNPSAKYKTAQETYTSPKISTGPLFGNLKKFHLAHYHFKRENVI